MPRPRFQKMEPSRRRALLDAAATEFAAKGYEGASVNAILEAAGFSKGSFYYYFDDKADLASEVLLEAYAPVLAVIDEPTPGSVSEFWDEVLRLHRRSLDVMEASPRTFQLISKTGTAVISEPALAARLVPLITEARKKVRAVWLKGQELGAVRTDLSVDAIMAMVEAVKRAAWLASFPPEYAPSVAEVEAFSRRVLDLAQRLATPGSSTAASAEAPR
ncbi:MAG: TetR/AcrR family transcriptional regulator [Myxococcota bacterium]